MTGDQRIDRLYELLPAVYRVRDSAIGHPLRDLLRVVAEQVNIVEDDIAGLYDNWFIETCQDWVVPYLGELIGWRPVGGAGDLAGATGALARALAPRREVAATMGAHRRKGTLSLLEELAGTVAGWPARAVEFYRSLAVFPNVNHWHPERGRAIDVRRAGLAEAIDGPFDPTARVVDVRRISSAHQPGRYNIPNVGVFVWRVPAYAVTAAPAVCLEEVSAGSFMFSVIGADTALFTGDGPPTPIRRWALARGLDAFYGPGRAFEIEVETGEGPTARRRALSAAEVAVADLSGWSYGPGEHAVVAVDPELGRMAFAPGSPPSRVWVTYHYGFSADLGGGEYPRDVPQPGTDTFYRVVRKPYPLPDLRVTAPGDPRPPAGPAQREARVEQNEREGAFGQPVASVAEALKEWEAARGRYPRAVIEIADNEVYTDVLDIRLRVGESLEIRAAEGRRPVLYPIDRAPGAADAPRVRAEAGRSAGAVGGCFRLDGVIVAGRPLRVEGSLTRVELRHCTLVPGWDLRSDREPRRPAAPSLELYLTDAAVSIERCVVGSIQVYERAATSDPVEITITGSVIDATSSTREAIGAPNWPLAHATVCLRDTTVFGTVLTHAIRLASNCVFTGQVRVARSQFGAIDNSYVPPGSRTPPRRDCQPDLVEASLRSRADFAALGSSAAKAAALAAERARVLPRFVDERYGSYGYARLADGCPTEITQGADDEAEVGAFHDLYQPQRLANLRARLSEFSPARVDVAVVAVT